MVRCVLGATWIVMLSANRKRKGLQMKTLDYILLYLSVCIVLYLLKYHTAPWKLIAAYWAVNAVKNAWKVGGK